MQGRSHGEPSRDGSQGGHGAPSPGKRAPTSRLSAPGTLVPPELLACAGTTLSDGGGFSYRVDHDGAFEVITAPAGFEHSVGQRITVDGRHARSWRALCAIALARAPTREKNAPAATEGPAETSGLPGVAADIGDAVATAGDALSDAVGSLIQGVTGGLADAAQFLLGGRGHASPHGSDAAAAAPAPADGAPPKPARGPIGSDLLTAAMAYYDTHRAQYVTGVVQAIGTKVGARGTTHIDDAFIDAVAAYQTDHGLAVTGIAETRTLVRMFGRDICMAANSVDPELVESCDGMRRVNPGVVVTPAIREAWSALLPFLPAGAIMTSGVRTWDKTVEILIGYVKKKAPKMIELGLTTRREVDRAIAEQDFGALHRLGNLDYDKDGDGKEDNFVIAGPGNSPHVTGYAFDVSGADISAIDAAVHRAASASDPFGALFQKTIPERGNNCVHVELKGAHIVKE
jgi:hypothetical protein